MMMFIVLSLFVVFFILVTILLYLLLAKKKIDTKIQLENNQIATLSPQPMLTPAEKQYQIENAYCFNQVDKSLKKWFNDDIDYWECIRCTPNKIIEERGVHKVRVHFTDGRIKTLLIDTTPYVLGISIELPTPTVEITVSPDDDGKSIEEIVETAFNPSTWLNENMEKIHSCIAEAAERNESEIFIKKEILPKEPEELKALCEYISENMAYIPTSVDNGIWLVPIE